MVIFREFHVDGEFFTRFVTHDAVFKAWDHAALAHRQNEIRGFAAFKLFAVYGTREIDSNAIFSGRFAFFLFPGRLLLAQRVQHGVHIFVSHFNDRFFNLDGVQTFQLNFRVNFKLNGVSKVFALLIFARHVVRRAGRIDFFFDDGVNKVALHQIAQHILANRGAVTLSHYAHRHFALTETVDTDFLRYFDQLFFHSVLDAVSSDSNRNATAQALSGFY